MKKYILISVLIFASPAMAQQQSPAEQVLAAKLMQELQSALACSADVISLRVELSKAQAKVKELEDAKEKGK